MNERITKPENDAPTPLAHVPGQPYTQARDAQGRPMTGREAERFTGRGEPLTRTERLLVTMFVTMFATMIAAGALAFTTLSGQLVDMQEQTSAQLLDMQEQTSAQLLDMQRQTSVQLLDMQKQIGGLRAEMHEEIGELSERMTRIATLIETRLVPASDARDPAGP